MHEHLADDGSWFVNIKASSEGLDTSLYVMDLVCSHVRQWEWRYATEFCWERLGVPKSVTSRFKNQFEPVYQFVLGKWKMRPGEVRYKTSNARKPRGPGVGDTGWGDGVQGTSSDIFGGAGVVDGLAYPGNRLPPFTPSVGVGHSAVFPIGLPRFFFLAYSDEGDIVFDPFMGSGTTMLAAHRTNRVARGCEISPAYCDVIATRWCAESGQPAVIARDADRLPFNPPRVEGSP